MVGRGGNARSAEPRAAEQDLLLQTALDVQRDGEGRRAALDSLEDLALLARVAAEANDDFLRQNAIGRISFAPTGRPEHSLLVQLLVQIALSAPDLDPASTPDDGPHTPRMATTGLSRLKSDGLLVRVAVEAPAEETRLHAVERLADRERLEQIAATTEDAAIRSSIRIYVDVLSSAIGVDSEDRVGPNAIGRVRPRDIAVALGTARVLRIPAVAGEVELISLGTRWNSTESAPYENARGRRMAGATVRMRLVVNDRVEGQQREMSYLWTSSFPPMTRTFGFVHADVEFDDVIEDLFKLLSPTALASIASDDGEPAVRRVALSFLSDEEQLARVALESRYGDARVSATSRLTDSDLLAKIAAEDQTAYVRDAAGVRLSGLRPSSRPPP